VRDADISSMKFPDSLRTVASLALLTLPIVYVVRWGVDRDKKMNATLQQASKDMGCRPGRIQVNSIFGQDVYVATGCGKERMYDLSTGEPRFIPDNE
jgi:hypothetical protein